MNNSDKILDRISEIEDPDKFLKALDNYEKESKKIQEEIDNNGFVKFSAVVEKLAEVGIREVFITPKASLALGVEHYQLVRLLRKLKRELFANNLDYRFEFPMTLCFPIAPVRVKIM